MMTSKQVRQCFIDYFVRHGHQHLPSSPLVPIGDQTLLFANAGMNQFKNTFLGFEKRPYQRAVTSQKCVRAGGKHNDLENVGHTARHHTFFEMLGNFSFGDYFKKDAIRFAWELLTKEFGFAKDRLYITVHTGDDEAVEIWHKQEGVPRDRIFRFDSDNFWRMGDTGPCGPCSEIYFDHGAHIGSVDAKVGDENDRFVEIWNLVFMQYSESSDGMTPLPNPSIDTGMGLERVTAALQGKVNNYDTDLFSPLIEEVCRFSHHDYVSDEITLKQNAYQKEITAAMRVLADHARATTFLIADGVIPSNEGRGYVLRRIIRRAIRYGRKLTDQQGLLSCVVKQVIQTQKDDYPEIGQHRAAILAGVEQEEERFLHTLDQGTHILNEAMNKLEARGVVRLDGPTVFKLYDTFGFPMDLTRLMAKERGFSVDEQDFEKRMQDAKQIAKASWRGQGPQASPLLSQLNDFLVTGKISKTQFTGYDRTCDMGKIIFVHSESTENLALTITASNKAAGTLKQNERGFIGLDQTCFYAEGGGQVGDRGHIKTATGVAEVLDCTKHEGVHLHRVEIKSGFIEIDQVAQLEVLESQRRQIANNHSATHLLHSALRKSLGPHVTQAGSLVDSRRLRFDFTHPKALTSSELATIEKLVNEQISAGLVVIPKESTYQKAIEQGAIALFGEKYGPSVRVIKMGDFSTELCGGTHVTNTQAIRLFKIVSEGSVSSGVRRLEAITGDGAVEYVLRNTQENLRARQICGLPNHWSMDQSESPSVSDYVTNLKMKLKELEKQSAHQRNSPMANPFDLSLLIKNAKKISVRSKDLRVVASFIPTMDRQKLSEFADLIRHQLQSGCVILVGSSENENENEKNENASAEGSSSWPILVAVSSDLQTTLHAGRILQKLASILGGKGGGRPDFAQGVITDKARARDVLNDLSKIFED